MPPLILTNSKIFFGGFDFSADSNSISSIYTSNLQDDTAFGDDTISRKGGLKGVAYGIEGLWNNSPDLQFFNNMGVADVPLTLVPESGADGERSFVLKSIAGSYEPAAPVGEMFKFGLEGNADKIVKSIVMHSAAAAIASTTNGTARQLGAVSATQRVYSVVHVIAASGASPTLDITIESDDNAGMASAVQRIAHTQFTTIGSEWSSLVGAITDDYWRVVLTVGGGSPSFTVIVSIGII